MITCRRYCQRTTKGAGQKKKHLHTRTRHCPRRGSSRRPRRRTHRGKSAMNPFAKKPTPREVMRSSKRDLTNATRGIERDIASLQQEEKKLVAEIKRTAKTGNEAATKILARQLIRLRQQISNLQGSRAQIQGIATHTQAMHANTSVATGLQSASKAMGALNKQMAPEKQMQIMKEFQKQSAQMDMTNEMMSDSIDDVLDDDQAEEETEELANQVLDEIGVDIASQLSSAPKGKIAGKKVQVDESSELEELEKRLAALKNP
ncbi:vacuolar protein sorting-associated protein 2 homolog 3-like [Panicum virgatum]|nr:vacuolar protein sorting-associated protein 2 homolog 3-like [Panicum virgatum]